MNMINGYVLALGRVNIQMCYVSVFMCAHVCVSKYKCVYAFIYRHVYISESVCLDICVCRCA